jgi:hypothetical protein
MDPIEALAQTLAAAVKGHTQTDAHSACPGLSS